MIGRYGCFGSFIMMIELKTSMAEMCWLECNLCIQIVHGFQISGQEKKNSLIAMVSSSYIPTNCLPIPSQLNHGHTRTSPNHFGCSFVLPPSPSPFDPQKKPAAFSSVPSTASAPSQVISPSPSSSPPPPPR